MRRAAQPAAVRNGMPNEILCDGKNREVLKQPFWGLGVRAQCVSNQGFLQDSLSSKE